MKLTSSMASLLSKTPAGRSKSTTPTESSFRFTSDVIGFRDKFTNHEVTVTAPVAYGEDPTLLAAVRASSPPVSSSNSVCDSDGGVDD